MPRIPTWKIFGQPAIVSAPSFSPFVFVPHVIAPFSRRTDFAGLNRALVCAALVLCAGGCVQRRITIRSNPPGALVYVDKYEIGKTPCSVEYIYYGTREVKLIKDGFETLTVMQWIPPPWYQIPPIDFISENIVPTEIRDERTYNYQLVPTRVVPTNQLLGRAENLRQATRLENLSAAPRLPSPAPRPPQMPLLPAPQPPGLVVPRAGGRVAPPGMAPSGSYPPAGAYPPPGMYRQPGAYPPPQYLRPSGPLPPRGPQ
jgi:hypothetical protein